MSQSKNTIIVLLLLGCLVFSPLGSTIALDFFHFPVSVPELFLLLFIPFLKERFHFKSLKGIHVFFILTIWLILIWEAFLIGTYSYYAILSTARSYMYVCIFYFLFNQENNVQLDDILCVSLGCLLGWCIESVIQLYYAIVSGNAPASYGTMLCIPLLFGITIFEKRYRLLVFVLLLCVVLSLIAGIRRQIAVSVVSLFLIYSFIGLQNYHRFFKLASCSLLFLGVLFVFMPSIEKQTEEISPLLHHRIFVKTQALLNGDAEKSGDDIRKKSIQMLFDNLNDYLYPRGFVSKQTNTDINTGIYNDLPLLELCYSFGVIITFVILLYFLYASFRCIKFYFLFHEKESILFVISFFIMVMLLFLEGGFISYPYAVPITGLCLGRLHYFSRIHFKKKSHLI